MNKYILFISAALLFAGCKTKQAITGKNQPEFPAFDTEGHRGARGLMPENTIPAMIYAVDLGVTTLEMDAHITKDHKVILSHDPYFNRLFALRPDGTEIPKAEEKKHLIYQMNYDEIKKYDVGSKYYSAFPQQKKMKVSKPLLSAVIDSVQAYLKANNKPQVFYNIETKSKPAGDNITNPEPEVFVKQLMDVIESKKITPWVIIQSFDIRTLQVLHKKYPQVKTSLLVSSGSLEENLQKLGFMPTIYSPAYKLVDAELVKNCHDKQLKIVPWTVNTKQEIDELKALGVDGIISDYPNLFFE